MIVDVVQASKYHETYPDAPQIRRGVDVRKTGWVVYNQSTNTAFWFSNRGKAKKYAMELTGKP